MSTEKPAARATYFVWGEGRNGPEIPLPQYDVSDLNESTIRSIDQKTRLRIPNHLGLVKGICKDDLKLKRLVLRTEGERKIAIALDQDIRTDLRAAKARPLNQPYRHRIVSGA